MGKKYDFDGYFGLFSKVSRRLIEKRINNQSIMKITMRCTLYHQTTLIVWFSAVKSMMNDAKVH